jgi:hypothetical protein
VLTWQIKTKFAPSSAGFARSQSRFKTAKPMPSGIPFTKTATLPSRWSKEKIRITSETKPVQQVASLRARGCCGLALVTAFIGRRFNPPDWGCCCAYGAREPLRQAAVLRIGFEFRGCHALEQFVQVDVFAAADPLTRAALILL